MRVPRLRYTLPLHLERTLSSPVRSAEIGSHAQKTRGAGKIMKRVRDKEETAVADDCLVLSITFDLLVHILSYACPGAYQALALTCKVFCDCTKKPAFWNRAIRLTTQARLDACGVIRSEIPPLLYQDLDLFFRFDHLSNYALHNLPWHYWLRWLYKPLPEVPERITRPAEPEQGVFELIFTAPKGVFGQSLAFTWHNNFSRFSITMFTPGTSKEDYAVFNTIVHTACIRHPRLIYVAELVKEKPEPWQRCHLVCRLEDGRIWHGRGLDRDVPDFSDQRGYYTNE